MKLVKKNISKLTQYKKTNNRSTNTQNVYIIFEFKLQEMYNYPPSLNLFRISNCLKYYFIIIISKIQTQIIALDIPKWNENRGRYTNISIRDRLKKVTNVNYYICNYEIFLIYF